MISVVSVWVTFKEKHHLRLKFPKGGCTVVQITHETMSDMRIERLDYRCTAALEADEIVFEIFTEPGSSEENIKEVRVYGEHEPSYDVPSEIGIVVYIDIDNKESTFMWHFMVVIPVIVAIMGGVFYYAKVSRQISLGPDYADASKGISFAQSRPTSRPTSRQTSPQTSRQTSQQMYRQASQQITLEMNREMSKKMSQIKSQKMSKNTSPKMTRK